MLNRDAAFKPSSFFAAVLFAAILQTARAGEPEKPLSAAQILPSGTVMFVEVAPWTDWSGDFSQTALAKVFAEPEVKSFLAGPVMQLSKLIPKPAKAPEGAAPAAPEKAPGAGGGMQWADLIPTGPLTFAVRYGPEDIAAKRPAVYALISGSRDLNSIEPNKQLLLTVLDALVRGKEIEKVVHVEEYLNIKLLAFKNSSDDGKESTVAVASTFKNRVILSNDLDFTRQIMDGLNGTAANKLADDAAFKSTGLAEGENFSAYLNISGMQAAFGSLSGQSGAPQQPADVFALLGLGQTGAAAWSLKMDGPAFESRAAVFAKGERGGLLGTLDEQPLSPEALKIVPDSAPFAAGFRLRSDHLMEFIRNAVKAAQGQKAYDDFLEVEKQLNVEFGRNLEKDIIAAYGNELVFTSMAEDSGAIGAVAQFAASLSVQDEKKAGEILTQVLTRLAAKMDAKGVAANVLKEIDYEGVKVWYLNPPQSAADVLGLAPAFILQPNRLIVALDVRTLKRAVHALKETGTLVNSKRFTEALAGVGGKMGPMFIYVDWAYVYKTAFSVSTTAIKLIAPPQMLKAMGVDLNLLPTTEAVTQHLFPGLTVAQITPNGVTLASRSPLPSAEVLTPPLTAIAAVYASFKPKVATPK